MSDTEMRALVDAIPVPAFDTPAFLSAPLASATVAIVTTAGLSLPARRRSVPAATRAFE